MNNITNLMKSETLKGQANELLENAIGIIMSDPVAAIKAAGQLIQLPATIRDGIFCENFQCFLMHTYESGDEESVRKNNRSLAEMLAEQSPNEESGYEGDLDKLRENAKRLIKLIEDAGTKQKATYIANLTRAVLNEKIDIGKYFKLCNCIIHLIEEDLQFLSRDIPKTMNSTITEDWDTIDDFRSVGVLKEVEGGFGYTTRAFELLKYGLCYEETVHIPDNIPGRMMSRSITSEEIENVVFDDEKRIILDGGTIIDSEH